MKTINQLSRPGSQERPKNIAWKSLLFVALLAVAISGCKKYQEDSASQSIDEMRMHNLNLHGYSAVNLVSDVAEYNPAFIDTNLVNAWGLAFGPTGNPWVSSTEKGVTTIYNQSGATVIPPVAIPFHEEANGGEPTGAIFNSTSDFVISSSGQTSKFIFVTENGTIAAWSSGTSAVEVADRSSFDAVYKGLAMATNNGANYLYATNFKGNTVDVFDNAFNYVSSISFVDPNMPAGFAPFGIENINGMLYVTYALQLGPDNEDDQAGPGNGYVDIYNPDGSLVSRFASQGTLNSPWAILYVPSMNNQTATILIGNFGDGRINAFTTDGTLIGPLKQGNTPLEVEGLWALEFAPNSSGDGLHIFFTAGPDDEEHGVFGVISKD